MQHGAVVWARTQVLCRPQNPIPKFGNVLIPISTNHKLILSRRNWQVARNCNMMSSLDSEELEQNPLSSASRAIDFLLQGCSALLRTGLSSGITRVNTKIVFYLKYKIAMLSKICRVSALVALSQNPAVSVTTARIRAPDAVGTAKTFCWRSLEVLLFLNKWNLIKRGYFYAEITNIINFLVNI